MPPGLQIDKQLFFFLLSQYHGTHFCFTIWDSFLFCIIPFLGPDLPTLINTNLCQQFCRHGSNLTQSGSWGFPCGKGTNVHLPQRDFTSAKFPPPPKDAAEAVLVLVLLYQSRELQVGLGCWLCMLNPHHQDVFPFCYRAVGLKLFISTHFLEWHSCWDPIKVMSQPEVT